MYQKNLRTAKNFNAIFSTLTEESACSPNQAACVGGSVSKCGDSGVFKTVASCGNGTMCFAPANEHHRGRVSGMCRHRHCQIDLGNPPCPAQPALLPLLRFCPMAAAPPTAKPGTTTVTLTISEITVTVRVTQTPGPTPTDAASATSLTSTTPSEAVTRSTAVTSVTRTESPSPTSSAVQGTATTEAPDASETSTFITKTIPLVVIPASPLSISTSI